MTWGQLKQEVEAAGWTDETPCVGMIALQSTEADPSKIIVSTCSLTEDHERIEGILEELLDDLSDEE